MFALATLRCIELQTALAVCVAGVVGLKPPWNQPQLTWWALSRSPMFLPESTTLAAPLLQSSSVGGGSPMIVLFSTEPEMLATSVPCVWPEIRLIAPTVDGPKFVP